MSELKSLEKGEVETSREVSIMTPGILKSSPPKLSHAQSQPMEKVAKYIKRKSTINKTVVIGPQSATTENGGNIDSDVYHKRRKHTNYLVGFDDLEPPLASIIQNNSKLVTKLQEETKQLNKEFIDNKR